jgi:hypothetical protein
MTTRHDVGGVLGRPWTLSFGLSDFHGHSSWLMCEVVLGWFIGVVGRFSLIMEGLLGKRFKESMMRLLTRFMRVS